jgi:hypothetical protein
MSIGIGILESSRSGGAFDADAQAFFNRVTAAGGTLNATEKTAVNTLVLSLKSAGIYSKFQIIYPMVGASAAACAQNLISSSFTGAFLGGWAFSSNGIQPNATNTWMNTNFACSSNMTPANWHQSYYSRTNSTVGIEAGVGDVSGYPSTLFRIRNASNSSLFVCGNNSNYGLPATTVTDSRGLFLGSILSSTDRKYFRNLTTIATNTANITNLIYPGTLIIGAYNEGGVNPRFFTDKQCAFYSIGLGLTTAEANSFYTTVQTFQTTLSRQV